jgi:hypothetical protein
VCHGRESLDNLRLFLPYGDGIPLAPPVLHHDPPPWPRLHRRSPRHGWVRAGMWWEVPWRERGVRRGLRGRNRVGYRDQLNRQRRRRVRRSRNPSLRPLVWQRSGLRARPHRRSLQRPVLMRRYSRERDGGSALSVRDRFADLGGVPLRGSWPSALSWRSMHALRVRSRSTRGLWRRGNHHHRGRLVHTRFGDRKRRRRSVLTHRRHVRRRGGLSQRSNRHGEHLLWVGSLLAYPVLLFGLHGHLPATGRLVLRVRKSVWRGHAVLQRNMPARGCGARLPLWT